MRKRTWDILEWLLEDALARRRALEAETVEIREMGSEEAIVLPAEGQLHAEWAGTLPPDTDSIALAKALEDLREC